MFCDILHASHQRLISSLAYGAIHKLRHTNFMICLPLPVLVTSGHISETLPPPSKCDAAYFAILHVEVIKLE